MFTSSFDGSAQDATPRKSWGWCWLGVPILCCALVSSVEAYWRARGFRSDVPNTKELWEYWRSRVYDDDGQVIVLLGTSRMKADIDLDTVKQRLPRYRVVQLAIVGDSSPIGTLQNLAEDERFRGIVLCGIMAPLFDRPRWNDQRDFYGHRSASRQIRSTVCTNYLQEHLVAFNSRLRLTSLLTRWLDAHQLPKPDFKRQTFRRSLQYDFFRSEDLGERRQRRAEQYGSLYAQGDASNFVEMRQGLRELNESIQRIRDRGGDVVFVRLPSSGKRLQLEEDRFLKSEFWDRIRGDVLSPCIHFQEVPALAGFECPDDSHLDCRDTTRFTAALIEELMRVGEVAEMRPLSGAE